MIYLLFAGVVFYLWATTNIVVDGETVNRPTFAVLLFNSCQRHLPDNAALLMTAHGVLESGYGTSLAFVRGNNVYNITAGAWWKSKGFPYWTQQNGDDQYDANGNYQGKITQEWRIYDSLDSSVDDYLDFLENQNGGRYKKAYEALLADDASGFCEELYAAGYYTLPVDQFKARLIGCLNTAKAMIGV